MQKFLDLHIHSKYSRACSKSLELPLIAKTCEVRGIDIVVTGDFTHPAWFKHIQEHLVEDTKGVYKLKDNSSKTRFLLGTEVASIKKHKGKTRRIHLLLFAPNIETAERFNTYLDKHGYNLKSDGRPILGLTCKDLLQICLDIDPRMVMIPAHAWTPWFGIFGSKGGYDHLEEAFEELTPHIRAIETGLSSDPLMNWQLSSLDPITLISNSDAHSPQKLGREANIFSFEDKEDVTYDEIMRIIREGDRKKFHSTIEFYPEEGKYHYDGHAACKFSCHPKETKKYKGICPVCKKPLTIGVMHRVDELADRDESMARAAGKIPYTSLVPLPEILSDTLGVGVQTKTVQRVYNQLIDSVGNEFYILKDALLDSIAQASSAQIADAVSRVRQGNIHVVAGYDGVFGVVKVFQKKQKKKKQLDMDF